MLRAPWECIDCSDVEQSAASAAAVEQPELPRSPAARRALAYEAHKAELSRAWLGPRRAPWGTQTPQWPLTWTVPFLDPVEAVVTPSAFATSKGSGLSLTAEEIEAVRAEQRAAFKERLAAQWRWNVSHL